MNVRRRLVLGFGMVGVPSCGFAQRRLPRIAYLGLSDPGHPANLIFLNALADSGYVNNRSAVIERRDPPEQLERMPDVLESLMVAQPDVLVVWGTVGAVAARRISKSVPVIFMSVGAPVEIGLVQSLARPGGNMTGITFEAASETYGKRLQLLKDILPRLERVGVLQAAGDANVGFAMSSLNRVAPTLGVSLIPIEVRTLEDIKEGFAAMLKGRAQAVLVVAGALTFRYGKQIASLALTHRIPSMHAFRETVEAGGLVSLGPDYSEMARRGAAMTTLVLKGTATATLPVEQPTRYEMVVNMETAHLLGLNVRQEFLLRADRIIEKSGEGTFATGTPTRR